MRFVIDMNLSPSWVDALGTMGHHAVHWSTIGEINASDTRIMEWAREHGSIVFTHDLDYGALLHATAATAPSVIQIMFALRSWRRAYEALWMPVEATSKRAHLSPLIRVAGVSRCCRSLNRIEWKNRA